MSVSVNIPQVGLPVLTPQNTFQLPWLRFFQQLISASGGSIDPSIIAALEAEIANAISIAETAESEAAAAQAAAQAASAGLSTLSLLGVSALDEALAKITLTAPSIFNVAGSPVYNVGTLAITLANENSNLIFAGPSSGGATTPTFRSLVNADFPTSGVTAATYGSSSNIPQFSVNAQGIITSASNVAVTIPASANPTATASDTAVNGTATTFMRSDAAPAVQKGLSSQFGVVKVDGATLASTLGIISISLSNVNTWSGAQTFQELVVTSTTFATLPASPADGQKGYITDGSVPASGNFGAIAAGGGTNHLPLYYDGGTSNWRIG